MFSGIVEEVAVIDSIIGDNPIRMRVLSQLNHEQTKLGDSIAIDGVCLTVVHIEEAGSKGTFLDFELSQETIRCSIFSSMKIGDNVNLERSLKLGDKISGHFVFGHVDGVTNLLSKVMDGGAERYTWTLPANLRGMIANKGSISISGVSLTTADVSEEHFSTYIIPHTAKVTTLSSLKPGMCANLEIDMLVRYVTSFLRAQKDANPEKCIESGITENFLKMHGYLP